MTAWLSLAAAIVFEVTGTLGLRVAVRDRRWYALVVVAYLLAFTMLSTALAAGIALGVAYGIWTAVGVALTAALSRVFFGEPFTVLMRIGVALIAGGVLLIETGAAH